MADAPVLLERLQQPAHQEALARILVDHALQRPVREFVEPRERIPAFVAALQSTVQSPGFAAWVQQRIEKQRELYDPKDRMLGDILPPELPSILKQIAARPYVPERELVRPIIFNDAMKGMVRSILQRTLTEFGNKLWSTLPTGKKSSRGGVLGSRLMGVAKSVVSTVGDLAERQLDDKVSQFIDGALDNTLEMVVDRICKPPSGPDSQAWKGKLLDTLLEQPLARFVEERRKIEPEVLAQDLQQILAAYAQWEGLEDELKPLLEAWAESLGDQSLREFLADSGVEESWRSIWEAEVLQALSPLLESEAFGAWLTQLCQE